MNWINVPFKELEAWINRDEWGMLSFKWKGTHYFVNITQEEIDQTIFQIKDPKEGVLIDEIEEWIKKDKVKEKLK